jgi:hypothetical protein
MAVIYLRGVEEEDVRRWKVAALESGKKLKEWIVEALREQTNGSITKKEVVKKEGIKAKPNGVRVEEEVVACKRCGGRVNRDVRDPEYYYCFECKRQLDESEIKRL